MPRDFLLVVDRWRIWLHSPPHDTPKRRRKFKTKGRNPAVDRCVFMLPKKRIIPSPKLLHMKSTIRRTTEFGISNTGKTCEIPSASAQPPTAYATATVKTLRLFSSSKNSLGSMAVCPKLSPFQRSFTSSTVNDQVAPDLPHRLGKLRPITAI